MPRRFSPRSFRSFVLLASSGVAAAALTLAAAGCWYSGHANGESSNLEFSVTGGPTAGAEVAFHLVAARYPSQWQSICTTEPNDARIAPVDARAGATRVKPQGGNIPCGNAPLASTPLALVEAHCDDDACTVGDDTSRAADTYLPAGALWLRVTPHRAGAIRVRLSVRATDGSGSWTDAYQVGVAAVDRVAWDHPMFDDAPAGFGVLVGTPAHWHPWAIAGDGTTLAAASDAFVTTWDGDAFAAGADGVVRARKPGVAHVTMSVAGHSATETLRVIDPSEVTAMDVWRQADAATSASSRAGVEGAALQGDALARLDVDTADFEVGPFAVVLSLRDGTSALGGVSSLAVVGGPTGDDRLFVVPPDEKTTYGWTFWIGTHRAGAGTSATLTGKVGDATLSMPMPLFDSYRDAGTDG